MCEDPPDMDGDADLDSLRERVLFAMDSSQEAKRDVKTVREELDAERERVKDLKLELQKKDQRIKTLETGLQTLTEQIQALEEKVGVESEGDSHV